MRLISRCVLASAALAVALPVGAASAGILGIYSFTGTDPGGDADTPNLNATAAPNISYSAFSRTSLNSLSQADVHRSGGFATGNAIDTSQYLQFTVTADAGYRLDLESLTYSYARAGGGSPSRGPRSGAVRSSFENYLAGSGAGSSFEPANNGSTGTSTWNFTDYSSGSGGNATFRFYGWDSGSGHLDLDNVTLNGEVTALARLQASAAADPAGPVIVGANVDVDVNIQNTASGGTRQEGLNFNVSGTGDLTGGGSGTGLAPGNPQVVTLALNTAAAGNRGGNVNVTSNAWSTNGNAGQSNFTQEVTVQVFDHSNASFDTPSDTDEITVDFGNVTQGSTAEAQRAIHNLVATTGFTAGLDLDSIVAFDPAGVFSTTLAAFTNLAAGSSNDFALAMDTANVGSFSGSYTLLLSDQDLPGATGGQSLTINLLGNVVPIPEPASACLVFGGLALLLRRRR